MTEPLTSKELLREWLAKWGRAMNHPSVAHRAGCPVCNPGKTVPELNEAYRQEVRYQQIMREWGVGRLAP